MQYKTLTYDFECGIELFTACNYHCEYCSGPRVRKESLRGRSKEDAEQVIRFFNDTDKCWLLGLSGGEPTIHPNFRTLVEGLRQQHLFYFFSNLSFDLAWFTEFVPPERVQFIKASLHPKGDTNEFMAKFSRLSELGYNPILVMVSAPDQFGRIEQVAEQCHAADYSFTLSVMEGPYRGHNYPNDYTPEQQQFIEKYTDEPGNLIRLHTHTPGGLNTFGLDCPAGMNSFFLDMETGDLVTCESVKQLHGNVYQGTFSPQKEATCCPAVSGCVGYDRCMLLPSAYRKFFISESGLWKLQPVKEDASYPENLYKIINLDSEGATRLVHDSLNVIMAAIEGKRTLLWGAGIYGAKILYYLRRRFGEEALSNIIGFVDSLPDRQKQMVLGLPVHAPRADATKNVEIILITSYAFEPDIKQQAIRIGLPGRVIPLHQELLQPIGVNSSIF